MGSRDMTQPGAGLAACNQHHLPLRLLRPQPVPSRSRCPLELRGRFGVAHGLPSELPGGSASLPEPLWVPWWNWCRGDPRERGPGVPIPSCLLSCHLSMSPGSWHHPKPTGPTCPQPVQGDVSRKKGRRKTRKLPRRSKAGEELPAGLSQPWVPSLLFIKSWRRDLNHHRDGTSSLPGEEGSHLLFLTANLHPPSPPGPAPSQPRCARRQASRGKPSALTLAGRLSTLS